MRPALKPRLYVEAEPETTFSIGTARKLLDEISLSDIFEKKNLKGIVGASSNVLERKKPFLKLKYILWELSGHVCFQLHIVVRNLEIYKSDKFLENILTWAV